MLFIRGLEVGEMIKFSAWVMPYPVMEINFELLSKNEKHFVHEIFDQRSRKSVFSPLL